MMAVGGRAARIGCARRARIAAAAAANIRLGRAPVQFSHIVAFAVTWTLSDLTDQMHLLQNSQMPWRNRQTRIGHHHQVKPSGIAISWGSWTT